MAYIDKNGKEAKRGDVVRVGEIEYVATYSEKHKGLYFPRKDGSGWCLNVWTGKDEEIVSA